ncbi:LPS assembly protein LptD [Flocculibacter collagenilyticus]|uniref:LPS assembly protein LptD n=1 Tax=Flocculibacter collagenilyticus TaxID=2744479 RepID=UPI0018F77825|nr:LPS assembly protein LptD [Flocculibacter collagenilyticus]
MFVKSIKHCVSPVALIVVSSLTATKAYANALQCEIAKPNITIIKPDVANAINIYSNESNILEDNLAYFKGDVSIIHNDTQLRADTAEFSKLSQSIKASGNIIYTDGLTFVTSADFSADIKKDRAQLLQADYLLANNIGRGQASALTILDKQNITLENASFTTCPKGDESWLLESEKITISTEDGWGTAENSVLRLFDTPVVYIPYITFPIDERRTTGFLNPTISSSLKLGAEIETPFYWNIAPNYDATIAPRYMSKRGLQLISEFRFLTEQHQGLVHVEYLNKDNDAPSLDQRYLTHWQQKSDFNDKWRLNIDYTNVSDDSYFADLGSDYGNATDTHIYQEADLSYFGTEVDAQIKLQSFEILGNHQSPYKYLPQIKLQNTKPLVFLDALSEFDFNWEAEYSHFENSRASNSSIPISSADRFHIEPSLLYQKQAPQGSFLSELSLLYSYYNQSVINNVDNAELTNPYASSVSRTLPKLRINTKLNLERTTSWFNKEALQTVEPQLQYLYIPEKDQSNIGLYDTALLQEDYFGLFRDHRFSGLDRIAGANQITLGATTRLYDSDNEELFNLSIGQIFYLDNQTRDVINNQEITQASKSLLAAESFFHWHKRWYMYGGVQYDTNTKDLIKSNLTLDYRSEKNKLVQLNHRYSREVSGNEIEQVGLLASAPINDLVQFTGSYHRDLVHHRSIESYIGLQYESCCWALQMNAYRTLNTNLSTTNDLTGNDEFDTGISIRFVIKGLGDTRKTSATEMLNRGIFGYRRPYFLNN